MQSKNRRTFIKETLAGAGLAAISPPDTYARVRHVVPKSPDATGVSKDRIKFSVIGLNHGHIYGQTDAVI
ncbi:MAG TPA: twin-arginine translocation signal domain-containing protein, partial [Chryseosolibacter sp.]|nr:twin-arginine translocation signal domain-containing protein [Chryseosolibacter sp.]